MAEASPLEPDELPREGWFSDPRIAIAKRELSSLSREKTIVLALLIQLFIAGFSSFVVVGLTSMYDPGAMDDRETTIGVTGEVADELTAVAEEHAGLTPVSFPDRDAALAEFDRGGVDAVLVGSEQRIDSGSRIAVTAIVPAENIRSTVLVVQLRDVLTTLERNERIDRSAHLDFQPVDVPERGDGSPYFLFTYTVLIPTLLFLPPFISGSIAVDTITEELERGTLELLRVAPVSLVDIVDGKGAAMVLLAPLQAAVWIGLLALNGIAVSHIGWLLAFVTALAIIVVAVGLGLGLRTASRRQAQLLYSIVVLGLFGLAIALPEHPAATAAKLAVDSPTPMTYGHVIGMVVLASVLMVGLRRAAASSSVGSSA